METDPLSPVADRPKVKHRAKQKTVKPLPKGRPADLLACGVATLAALLAGFGSVIFFLGFAANDTVLAGLLSAFAFSVLLGAFAVAPAVIVACLAWRGWKAGLSRKNAIWCLILVVPWGALSAVTLFNAPLSKAISAGALGLSALLLIWAVTSLILGPGRNFEPL